MSFLTINGIAFPVAQGAFQEEPEEIGETTRAYSGTLRKSRQTVKRNCSFESTWMLSDPDAFAWDGFLRGLGETWSFDSDSYGSKGTGPNSSSGASIASGIKFSSALQLAATTGTITYPVVFDINQVRWTVMFWGNSGGTTRHYIIDSSGRKWINGSRNDAFSTPWLSVGFLTMTLSNATGSSLKFDDLVFVPYLLPTDWPPIFGVATSAFSLLPKLNVAGDAVIETTTRSCMGDVSTHLFEQGAMSGSFRNNLRKLRVFLQGV